MAPDGGALPPLRLPPLASNSKGTPAHLQSPSPLGPSVARLRPAPWSQSRACVSVAALGPPGFGAGAPPPWPLASPLGGRARGWWSAACRRGGRQGRGVYLPPPLYIAPASISGSQSRQKAQHVGVSWNTPRGYVDAAASPPAPWPPPPRWGAGENRYAHREGRVCAGNPGRVPCAISIHRLQNFWEVLKS